MTSARWYWHRNSLQTEKWMGLIVKIVVHFLTSSTSREHTLHWITRLPDRTGSGWYAQRQNVDHYLAKTSLICLSERPPFMCASLSPLPGLASTMRIKSLSYLNVPLWLVRLGPNRAICLFLPLGESSWPSMAREKANQSYVRFRSALLDATYHLFLWVKFSWFIINSRNSENHSWQLIWTVSIVSKMKFQNAFYDGKFQINFFFNPESWRLYSKIFSSINHITFVQTYHLGSV
jgi:hypothetical protein